MCERARALAFRSLALRSSTSQQFRWIGFARSVLPGPLLGAACPGPLAFKAIVATATAAAQSAYSLAVTEYNIAQAADAVALKSRAAAVADTYANQGARAGAILPFTSALAGLCAAASAALVEVSPYLSLPLPAIGGVFAAAASVSKARCEIDAEAAATAATELSNTPETEPIRGVVSLVELSVSSVGRRVRGARLRLQRMRERLRRRREIGGGEMPLN